MRNISFALTTPQFIAKTKTVTRRNGWKNLQSGTRLMGVEKGMGLKPGEQIVRLGEIEVLSVRREPLNAITDSDVIAEGFVGLGANGFIEMYCRHMKVRPDDEVTRIEFRYV